MPQVEFHILSQAGDEARLRHVCVLVLAHQQAQRCVFIRGNEADLRRLDELLWTCHDQAFIPHDFWRGSSSIGNRIVAWLGTDVLPDRNIISIDAVINLLESTPTALTPLPLIQEVVDAEPTRKQQARERYKQYREQGCELITHNH